MEVVMNNRFGRFLAILMLVWATISSAQTVELGGVSNDAGGVVNFGNTDGSNNEKVAMPLTLLSPVAISKIVVSLSKVGTPSDNVNVEVRQGSPDGSLLASGTVPGSNISNSPGPKYEVTVPTFTVPSGTVCVVLSRSGSSSQGNFFFAARGSSGTAYGSVSSGGFMYYRTGVGWNSSNLANSFIVSLWGTTVLSGQASDPANLGFGDVNTGLTSQLSLNVKNTGTAALSISSVASNNGLFTITPVVFPVNVAVGDSATFTVSFSPTSAGSVSGNITITHNGVNSPTVIAVTGNGVSSGGGGSPGGGSSIIVTGPVSFSSSTLDVGTANVGASSSRTLYLRNPDTLAVAITNISTTTSEFTVSPTLGAIPAGDSLLVTVSFNPSSSGSKVATLVANYATGSASAVLTAVGASGSPSPVPVLSVSNTTFSADSTIVGQTKGFVVPIQNTGASNLFVTNLYAGGNNVSAFTVTSPSAFTVGPGEIYNINVLFTPHVLGVRTATLNINHNGTGGSTTIQLVGVGKEAPPQAKPVINIKASSLSGMPPYSVTFTNDNTGGTVTRTEWQVKRIRDDAKGISSRSISEIFSGYKESYTYQFTEIGPYIVELELDGPGGADHQPMADTVWISIKDPKIAVSQEVVALPAVELGKGSTTAEFSISNVGESGLNVTSFRMSGLDSTDFSVVTEPDFSVSPNTTKKIRVEFKPTRTIGDKQTYLYIYFVGPDSPARIKLSSTATDPPWGPSSVIDFTVNNMNVLDDTAIDSATVIFTYRLEGLRYKSMVMHFGDGDSSTVINPTHKYVGVGKYSPSLVVTLANDEVVAPRTKENYIVISSPPLPPPVPTSPDFNGDKVVDMADFFMFADHFGKSVITDEDKKFDLAPDGKIDFLDYFLLVDAIGK